MDHSYRMLIRQKLKCRLFRNRTDDDEDNGNDDGDEVDDF